MNAISRQPGAARQRRLAGLAASVAVLLATAAGIQATGLLAIAAAMSGPTPGTTAWVVAVCLAASAIGMMLPEQLVVHFVRFAWARVRGVSPPNGPAEADRRFVRDGVLWMALAAVLVVAATAAMLALVALTLVGREIPQLLEDFLWTPWSARMAECVITAAVLSPMFVLFGVGLTFVHAVYRRPGAALAMPDLPSLVMVCLAGGMGIGRLLLLPRSTASHVVLLGVGVLCVAALLSVLTAGAVERRAVAAEPPTHLPPEAADTIAVVLLCIAVWGMVLATLAVSISAAAAPGGVLGVTVALCGFLILVGVADGLAERVIPTRLSLQTSSAAMLATAVLCLVAMWVARRLTGAAAAAYVAAGAVVLGVALAGGRKDLAARLSGEYRSMAEGLAAALAGLAGGPLLAGAWLVPSLGWPAGVALAGLAAAASAGVLAASERRSSVSAAVGTTAAALAVVLAFAIAPRPRMVARDLAQCPATPRLVGGPGARHPQPPPDVIPDADLLAWLRHLAGSPSAALDALVVQPGCKVRRLRWAIVSPHTSRTGPPAGRHDDTRWGTQVLAEERAVAAWRMLRVGLERYDLVIVGPRDSGVWSQAFWTSEFFRWTRRRLAEGGLAAVVVRPSAISPTDLHTLTATFAAVFPQGRCVGAKLNGRDVLALVGWRGDGRPLAWERLARAGPTWLAGYEAVLGPAGPVEIHGLRQPRLRGGRSVGTLAAVLAGGGWRGLAPSDTR